MATQLPGFVLIDGKWVIEKDPNAELDYYIGVVDLVPPGDTVVSVSIAVTGGLIEMTHSFTSAGVVTVWLKGGTFSRSKLSSCTVSFVTAGGRKDDRTVYFKIVEK